MAKSNTRRSNSTRRNDTVARVRSWGRPCALCGEPIDYGLPARHPECYECDEIVPHSLGGSPYDIANQQPAHRECNRMRGNRLMGTFVIVRDSSGKRRLIDLKESPKAAGNLPLKREW